MAKKRNIIDFIHNRRIHIFRLKCPHCKKAIRIVNDTRITKRKLFTLE